MFWLTRILMISALIFASFAINDARSADLDGLVLYLSFDDGKGKTAKDLSGNGNDGDLQKNPKWTKGKFDGGLELNGQNFVEIENSDTLQFDDELSLTAWINPKLAGSTWQSVITKGPDAAETFELLLNSGGFIHTAWQFAGGRKWHNWGADGTIAKDQWQHLAVTYKPGEWITYLDGKPIAVKKDTKDKLTNGDHPLLVGEELNKNRLFQGVIDEVAVFGRWISENEVHSVMEGIGVLLPVEPRKKITTVWAKLKI